ncbi:MAG: uroporphyrinogen-III synthase [Alphaproteobacteria bacterium]|nr:uroporphyrinogen-III synthase [Alphaproteobacteria bacterium]
MTSDSGGDDDGPAVWIPRPLDDARPLAETLAELGYAPLIAPLMAIKFEPAEVALAPGDALVFTSANGVRAFAAANPTEAHRDRTVFAVGAATASQAHDAGFSDIRDAAGDVETLTERIAADWRPYNGVLHHIAGATVAGDLKGTLERRGYRVARHVLYRADPADTLPEAVETALKGGTLAAALFYSPRTARIAAELIAAQKLKSALTDVRPLCLSAAVADVLDQANWPGVATAAEPTQASLLQLLQSTIKPLGEAHHEDTGETMTPGSDETAEKGDEAAESPGSLTPADGEAVIDRFGGIRPMAAALDIAVSTVQGWKSRNHIPENRWDDVLQAAEKSGVSLTAAPPSEAPSDAPSEDATPEADAGQAAADADETLESEQTPQQADEPLAEQGAEESDEQADAPPPEKTEAPKRSGGNWLALALSILALAAVLTSGYWGPIVDPIASQHLGAAFGRAPAAELFETQAAQEAEITALETRIDELKGQLESVTAERDQAIDAFGAALNTRFVELENALAAAEAQADSARAGGPSSLDLDAVADRLAALETGQETLAAAASDEAMREALDAFRLRLDAISESVRDGMARFERSVGGADDRYAAVTAGLDVLRSDIDGLRAEIEAVRAEKSGAIGAGPLLMTVAQLESVVASGGDARGLLAVMDSLAADRASLHEPIGALKDALQAAPPTLAALRQDFDRLAPEVDKAERLQGADNWVDETVATLRGLVSVRRTGDAPDLPIASRAEAALAKGELAAAIALVAPLAEANDAIAAWIARAEARVRADAAMKDLREASLRIAAATGPASPEATE